MDLVRPLTAFQLQIRSLFSALTFYLIAALDLSVNLLTGSIPTEIGLAADLGELARLGCIFWNAALSHLLSFLIDILGLFQNRLTGRLPSELGKVSRLGTFLRALYSLRESFLALTTPYDVSSQRC